MAQSEHLETLSLLGGFVHNFQELQDVNQNIPDKSGENEKDLDKSLMTACDYDRDAEEVLINEDRANSLQNSHSSLKQKCSLVCSDCGKRFIPEQLKKHRHKMHPKIIKRYHCDICNLPFNLPSDLKRHKISHGEPNFKCIKCLKSFKSKFNLKRHSKICN